MKESQLRLDDLGINGYRIYQDPKRFCFGMDAVLLSGFATVRDGQTVLDLGTGTGILPILLEAKTGAAHLTGLEIQEESADLARKSVELNGLTEKIDIVTGDIREADTLFGAASFDVITSNPPYMIGGHGLKNASEAKLIARHEVACNFDDIARVSSRLLVSGGKLFLVHRPFRLAELMVTLTKYALEPKRIRFVHPHLTDEPNMVLIEAAKGGKSRVTVEKPLIVYEPDGEYTDEIYDIYKMPDYKRCQIGE
ncbi:MAG: tRNA1(Val) (adenine(37)-N6)-methyltransferase [Lachnospiraceae bacterium]|nr:tRNA1(Val) (adenine(37)-N6)-methyltransferase [Lachnospiraceae bacterium]